MNVPESEFGEQTHQMPLAQGVQSPLFLVKENVFSSSLPPSPFPYFMQFQILHDAGEEVKRERSRARCAFALSLVIHSLFSLVADGGGSRGGFRAPALVPPGSLPPPPPPPRDSRPVACLASPCLD
jgi:hypothetical protein